MENCLLWKGCNIVMGEDCEKFSPREEMSSINNWNGLGLTATPYSAPPAPLRWRRQQSWAWEEGRGGGKVYLFKIWWYLSLFYSDTIGELVVVLLRLSLDHN